MQLIFNTVRGNFELLLEAITIFLMVSLALVVLIAVAYRLGGHSLAWYDEVAAIQLAWLTYYAGALAALKRAHIGVTGIVNAMPPAIRVPVVVLAECIVVGFFALMGWLGIEVMQVLEGDTLVSLPEVPTALTQSVIPVGAVLFIIAQILSFPEMLDKVRKGSTHFETEGDEP